jgi:hypothetical protein
MDSYRKKLTNNKPQTLRARECRFIFHLEKSLVPQREDRCRNRSAVNRSQNRLTDSRLVRNREPTFRTSSLSCVPSESRSPLSAHFQTAPLVTGRPRRSGGSIDAASWNVTTASESRLWVLVVGEVVFMAMSPQQKKGPTQSRNASHRSLIGDPGLILSYGF